MTARTKGVSKSLVFITKAIESLEDPLHEGEYPVYKWSIQMWGERDDGVWEDPSHWISRVAFELHPSFSHPRRVLSIAPYTVREKGWGEFDIGVEVAFTDPSVAHFQCQIPLLFDPVHETRIVVPFKNMSSEFREALMQSGEEAPQQPSSQSLHPVPAALADVAAVSEALSQLDQTRLKQLVQLVREASTSDKLVKISTQEQSDGSYVEYSLNLYDLPLDVLQRVALVVGLN